MGKNKKRSIKWVQPYTILTIKHGSKVWRTNRSSTRIGSRTINSLQQWQQALMTLLSPQSHVNQQNDWDTREWHMNRLPTHKRSTIHQLPAKQQQATITLSSQTIHEHDVAIQKESTQARTDFTNSNQPIQIHSKMIETDWRPSPISPCSGCKPVKFVTCRSHQTWVKIR